MSAMQREKGKAYERAIARVMRKVFPAADVRRTSQADRAANSDVVITGSPLLERLWLELNDARDPRPLDKLAQAERDIVARGGLAATAGRLPVVIWHRIHERTHQVTTRLWVLDEVRWGHGEGESGPRGDHVVTLDLGAFLALLWGAARAAA